MNRRLASSFSLAVALLLLSAASASAWYVEISITGAGRVYETTDADELDEHCPDSVEGIASPSTTPTGSAGRFCRAGDTDGAYGAGWIVRYVAEAAPGYRFDRWVSAPGQSESPVVCDNSGGSSDYTGAACQFQIWENLQVEARFVDDTDPAMQSLSGPAVAVPGPATFTFSATNDPTFMWFECRLTKDGSQLYDWRFCASGNKENPAGMGTEGQYVFHVRAVDWSGNRSPASTWAWQADKLSPETSLDGGTGPSGLTSSRDATFQFSSASADVAGYRCRLDGAEVGCASPKSYSDLPDGSHTFEVLATDDAGNGDASPATRIWTVDGTAPNTTIVGGPPSQTADTSASFAFESSEAGGGFRCQLDSGVIADCASPYGVGGLAPGLHTVRVWASDQALNEDPTPATTSWTVIQPAGGGGVPSAGAGGTGANATPADTLAPLMTVAHTAVTASSARVVNLRLGCPASEPVGCSGTVKLVTASVVAAGGAPKRRRVTIGQGSFSIAGGKSGIAKVRLTKPARRVLKSIRSVRVTVTIVARDQAGNTTTAKKTIRLKGARRR
jgi:hypothetical protein